MFYLTNFFRSIGESFSKGFLFFLVTVALIVSCGQKGYLEKLIFKSFPSKVNGPYFYALVSNKENISRVARKLSVLPGVQSTQIMAQSDIDKQVKKILGSYDFEIDKEAMNLNYYGLRVMFRHDTLKRSQQLIKEYVSRLVGESKVTIGPTHNYDKDTLKKGLFIKKLKEWSGWIMIVTLTVIWLLLFFTFGNSIKRQSYLVEQFQRRSNVSFKTLLNGMVLISLITSGSLIFWGSINWLNIMIVEGMFFIGVLTHLKKYSWKN